ncbi:oocyte zinc finger protein XlCOF28-like isoform X2 [Armigeres subalbatus]|uniref:oocyte zinc finger protein XlCOF28-like isoform X2 n=1 Tax=Armigeres subalbatus TaxID=124917 RepID=UPI002ED09E41
MGKCRLCSKDTPKNNRLDARPFREKVLDVICMWIDVNNRRLSKDVCDPCFKIVDKFYTFKRKCRTIQSGPKEPEQVLPEKEVPIPENIVNGDFKVVAESIDVSKGEDASAEEMNSEDEYFRSLPPLKKRKKYPFKKSNKPPELDENGKRIIKARPWNRKFKEAINLPPDEYRQYVMNKKIAQKPGVVCELCGKTIDCRRIDGHRNRHLGLEPYECELCGDKFNCKHNLRSHHRRNHVAGQECTCPICGKVFACRPSLQSHTKSVHGERNFPCTLCPLRFNNKSTLTYHLKIHNQTRDFKCELCGKGFYCKSVWNIHMRTHSGEAPYRCSVCEAAYVHRNMYVAHMKKNHPGVPLMQLSGKKGFKESLLKKGIAVGDQLKLNRKTTPNLWTHLLQTIAHYKRSWISHVRPCTLEINKFNRNTNPKLWK